VRCNSEPTHRNRWIFSWTPNSPHGCRAFRPAARSPLYAIPLALTRPAPGTSRPQTRPGFRGECHGILSRASSRTARQRASNRQHRARRPCLQQTSPYKVFAGDANMLLLPQAVPFQPATPCFPITRHNAASNFTPHEVEIVAWIAATPCPRITQAFRRFCSSSSKFHDLRGRIVPSSGSGSWVQIGEKQARPGTPKKPAIRKSSRPPCVVSAPEQLCADSVRCALFPAR